MEPINKGDLFRLIHPSHTVHPTHHTMIATRDQGSDGQIYAVFLTNGEGSGYESITLDYYNNPDYGSIDLILSREHCQKL